jgi:hypothetical protein
MQNCVLNSFFFFFFVFVEIYLYLISSYQSIRTKKHSNEVVGHEFLSLCPTRWLSSSDLYVDLLLHWPEVQQLIMTLIEYEEVDDSGQRILLLMDIIEDDARRVN